MSEFILTYQLIEIQVLQEIPYITPNEVDSMSLEHMRLCLCTGIDLTVGPTACSSDSLVFTGRFLRFDTQ